jgi:hypothetical protein
MTLRGLAAWGFLLGTTAVAAGCGGLRQQPQKSDAGADLKAADGSAGKDSGKDVTLPVDVPGDLSPADVPPAPDAPVERPPDVPPAPDAPADRPGDTPATDAPPTDVPVTEPPPACGNGRLDPGETCDPVSACATSCPAQGCQLRALTGAGTCQAACVAAGTQTACMNSDGCCPTGCNAINDSDCAARCGNGVVEPGELCDGNCPTSCPAVGCQQRTLQGSAATCDARCVNGATTTTCTPNDSCCPAGCNATNDADCVVRCGNGVVEPGELCDGNCPTSCAAVGCQLRVPMGNPAACNVQCVNGSLQTACANGDSCCPSACNSTNDSDCQPVCGNGVVERAAGETCDPPSACATQMGACVSDADNVRTSSGSVNACTYVCTTTPRACGPADGFCPTGCGPTRDVDCPGCGNGRIEAGETCDVAPAGVVCSGINCTDSDSCTADTRTGANASCNVGCTHTPITACTSGDGCCPGGGSGACNRNNDGDCAAVCGNGVVESGETCDTALANSCPTSCPQMACVLPALVNRGTCTAACVDQGNRQTACVDGDGCCPGAPSSCSDINDTDCATPNDTCANARDISAGGDFPFSLMTAKEETPGQCTPDGPEVFFTFTVANPSAVYLDVFDPNGKRVDVALEVWANVCPTATTKPIACDTADGGRACGGEMWPRIFFTNTDLRTFVVVARATNGVRGRYTLRFQYVPLACVAAGAFPVAGPQPLVDTTCGGADSYAPSCATPPLMTGGLDKTYYLVKCPAQTLSLSTCQGRTGNTDTVLLVNRGSLRVANGVCTAVASPIGREVACNDERTGACAVNPNNTHTSEITGAGGGDRGIYTITVDTKPIVGAANCGPFGLSWALQ